MFTFLLSIAHAATLPGVSIPFDVDDEGRWVLSQNLSAPLIEAGAQPGWVLLGVDGLAFDDPAAVQRRVASGPARRVQLRFAMISPEVPEDPEAPMDPEAPPVDPLEAEAEAPPPPIPETILVARRAPLVHAEELAFVPWPEGLKAPVGPWQETWSSSLIVRDQLQSAWMLDDEAGSLFVSNTDDGTDHRIPEVFWELSTAGWVFDGTRGLRRGGTDWAREQLAGAARTSRFRGTTGDHVVVTEDAGLRIWSLTWPRGTPALPTCQSRVPETCLASGMQILEELADRTGATEEAMRHLGLACANGVYRGCYESVALEDPALAPEVDECLSGDVTSCNDVAQFRFELDPESPDDLVLGLLEYGCELEGSGTLGERLRRLEDVGAGCILLSTAYDAKGMPDLALLNLDQACVLGRADACDKAADRRHQAYAARTVRECEDPDLPIASSCVDLGRLLQQGPVPAATLDDFGAFRQGCSLGAVQGCILLGDYVDRWGIGHPRVVEAEEQLLAACNTGEQRACVGTAHLLVRHEPRTDEYATALSLFSSACEAGLGEGCVAGAEQRRIGRARKVDAPSQIDLWDMACVQNEAIGCAGLADRTSKSKSSLGDAFAAYNRACELGHPHSCSELGQLVLRRHEPQFDGEQPFDTYLSRGCDNGDPVGCFWLAEDTLPKKGEPDESTYLLLDQSCEGEYGPGCAQLADVHLERKSNFDDEIAARHLDTACANGHYDSCRILGGMFLKGKGVEKDRQRANELLERFRLNARRRHLRIGPVVGAPYGVGGEVELVLPIPFGPAISVSGHGSILPQAGSALFLLRNEDSPDVAPNLQILGASARLYTNPTARGIFGAVGFHQMTTDGLDAPRSGWNARLGLRSQVKLLYTSLEIGMGQYGLLELERFDEERSAKLPLILPALGFSVGIALL